MNFVEIAIPFFILAMVVELAYGAWKKNQTYRLNDAVSSLMMGRAVGCCGLGSRILVAMGGSFCGL